ncbi:MAG: hypothetical protein AB1758_35285, partial [Candidatus Eremiobacterota bacterium]
MTVRGPLLGQGEACRPILEGLPEWFGIPEARENYVRTIQELPTWLAGDVGFLTLKRQTPEAAEVYCMGVLRQRAGIGR